MDNFIFCAVYGKSVDLIASLAVLEFIETGTKFSYLSCMKLMWTISNISLTTFLLSVNDIKQNCTEFQNTVLRCRIYSIRRKKVILNFLSKICLIIASYYLLIGSK